MNIFFFAETIRHRALIFGMKHHLVDLYPVCSNFAPGAKIGPTPGVTPAFNRYLYVSVKQNLGEQFWALGPLV